MKARRRHIPDSPECEQMPASGGGWIVGCDSYSFCFYCLRLYKRSILCTASFLLAVTFITCEPFVQSWSVTCTQLPSPWRSSYGWCTSWWVGTQPQSPGWLTGPVGQQTPGCWRSLGYNLEGTTETQPHRSQQLVTITFTVFRDLHKTEDIFWKVLGVFHCSHFSPTRLYHCCWWQSPWILKEVSIPVGSEFTAPMQCCEMKGLPCSISDQTTLVWYINLKLTV